MSEFGFALPEELIAQQPPAERGASRMLRLDRQTGAWQDRMFRELPELLEPGDLLVVNDTRVMPARLFGTRVGGAGRIEVLLTEQVEPWTWKALVRPGKKVRLGERLEFSALLQAEVVDTGEFGERLLRFAAVEDFFGELERIGHLPLPPYIRRGRGEPDSAEDRERYQTVYAEGGAGSAAAPTAGLHFTPEIFARLAARGVEVARVTLHVGLGTFQPVRVERTEEIRLHAEPYTLGEAAAEAINRAWAERRRIVAVGTTTTRTLEHVAREFERRFGALGEGNPLRLEAHGGATGLFLSPGEEGDGRFRLVGGLVTNFHLPESTLLMLVSAFAGRERVLAAYRHAVETGYHFFSYGDCMLLF